MRDAGTRTDAPSDADMGDDATGDDASTLLLDAGPLPPDWLAGDNRAGQLALFPDITRVVGRGHLCIERGAGSIACRGRGDEGQLGDGRSVGATDWVAVSWP